MYNQYSIVAIDLYRKYLGFAATRQRYKGRKDAFFSFMVDQENDSDHQTLRRLSVAISKIGDMCFKECIQPAYQIYTTDEEYCVRECVRKYFKGFQELSFYTNRKMALL